MVETQSHIPIFLIHPQTTKPNPIWKIIATKAKKSTLLAGSQRSVTWRQLFKNSLPMPDKSSLSCTTVRERKVKITQNELQLLVCIFSQAVRKAVRGFSERTTFVWENLERLNIMECSPLWAGRSSSSSSSLLLSLSFFFFITSFWEKFNFTSCLFVNYIDHCLLGWITHVSQTPKLLGRANWTWWSSWRPEI